MLRDCIELTGNIKPFVVNALVILPDHIHTIWTLPEHDADFSTRWKVLKTLFSKRYRKQASKDLLIPRSGRGEVGIWQRRFWEHLIRNQEDFNTHCDYLHYNPVKHGFVKAPGEWKYSSFKTFIQNGWYDENWGLSGNKPVLDLSLE